MKSATSSLAVRRNFCQKISAAIFLGVIAGATTVSAQRPLGVDISHYQGAVTWTSVKNSGVSFAWAKSSEGSGTGDAFFAGNVSGAKAAGVYIGAYHFAHPEANSAATEANFFWNVVANTITNDGLSLQPALDYETFTAPGGVPVGAASYADWANQWCNAVSNKAAAVGITIKPLIYTSTCEAGNLNTSNAQWPPWIANPSGLNPQTGSPWSSTSCNTSAYEIWGAGVWSVWQYSWTGSVPGISGACDMDVFNGTAAQLVTALVVGTNPPPLTVTFTSPLHRAVDTAGSAVFSATATGPLPLKYQWRLNGTNVINATNATINLANAQTTNSGFYTLVVTNASGSVTSRPVSLLVYPPQVTMFADNFDVNTAGNWIYNTSSGDNAVTFNFDYSALGIPSAPNATNGTTRGVQVQANLSLGTTNALSLSPTGQNFGGDYRLRFDGWINVNGPFPGGGSGSTELLTAGIGTSGTRTQWIGRNSTADGFYFSVNGDGGSGDTAATIADYNAYIGTTVQAAATGEYWAGTGTTARGNGNNYYLNAFPTGQAAPGLQQSAYPQQSGSLNAGTFGLAWHDVIVSKRGSTVDWVVDGVRFCTISNATFTASNVFVGFWDPFTSLSSNNVINFGLVDNVRVESPAVAPAWLTQPVAQSVRLGTNVTFAAAATGLPAPNYQWRFNGTNILGATNSSYVIAFAAPTNTGNYSVTASNFMGAVPSTNALLALVSPAAAQFTSIVNSSGAVQVAFNGDAYWTYTIEVSTNLTSWNSLTNLTSTNGIFNFTAGFTTDAPQQFFRARVGP